MTFRPSACTLAATLLACVAAGGRAQSPSPVHYWLTGAIGASSRGTGLLMSGDLQWDRWALTLRLAAAAPGGGGTTAADFGILVSRAVTAWQAPGADAPLTLGLPVFFREVWGE